jgi:hypothetical protein
VRNSEDDSKHSQQVFNVKEIFREIKSFLEIFENLFKGNGFKKKY